MMITNTALNTYLSIIAEQAPDEWSFPASRPGYWVIRHLGSRPPFDFYIEYNDDMLYVQHIIQDMKIKAACWLPLCQILLRLNEEISLVKFGLTPSNSVCLLGELPAASFSLDALQNLLRLLVHYLEQLYWELDLVATCPALAKVLAEPQAESLLLEKKMKDMVKRIEVRTITS